MDNILIFKLNKNTGDLEAAITEGLPSYPQITGFSGSGNTSVRNARVNFGLVLR